MSDCCPQSDLFLDMLALRLATALNYLFLDMIGLGRVIVAHNLSFSGHAELRRATVALLGDLFTNLPS